MPVGGGCQTWVVDRAKRTTLKQLAGTAFVASANPTFAASGKPDGALSARMATYDPVWLSQSRSAGESMPCGAGDIGLNIWVEGGDLLFYVQRSGAFDETNSYLKLGRARLRLDPSPFGSGAAFEQRLSLIDGEVVVTCGGIAVAIWASTLR